MQTKLAIKQAKLSNFKQRIGAVISKGSKTLGAGHNITNAHQGKLITGHYPGSIHAEVAAIIDVMRRYAPSELKGTTITIVRLMKDDSLGLAYPCEDCFKTIVNVGIKKIRFTNKFGTFSEIKV